MFGFRSLLPPLAGGGGGLVCESVDNVYMVSDHFIIKQYRESADLPLTCHPFPFHITVAFRSNRLRSSC